MSNAIVCREYNGFEINFDFSEDAEFVSLTNMAKAGGKLVADWTRQKSTQELIKVWKMQHKNSHNGGNSMVVEPIFKVQGGNNPNAQGTWAHTDIAIQFAQWVSPELALWVSGIIRELWAKGQVAIDSPVINTVHQPPTEDLLVRAADRIKEICDRGLPQTYESELCTQALKLCGIKQPSTVAKSESESTQEYSVFELWDVLNLESNNPSWRHRARVSQSLARLLKALGCSSRKSRTGNGNIYTIDDKTMALIVEITSTPRWEEERTRQLILPLTSGTGESNL